MAALSNAEQLMTRNWIWISGWAIDPDRFKAAAESVLPKDSHKVVAPTPDALQKVIESGADHIGGYSLGSLILLSSIGQIPKAMTIFCLAPFISFCKEDRSGGATPRTTVESLQKRLRTQPQKTLHLFYRLAGVRDPLPEHLPYSIDSLRWGLEQLAILRANKATLDRATGIAGLNDPLIDTSLMRSEWPTCHFVEGCNHDYRELLVALSRLHYF